MKEQFAYNWIVLPNANGEVDDTETLFWKSRDIDNNVTVLTIFPEKPYFVDYMEWQAFKNENSVNLPVYLIRKGKKTHKIYQSKIYLKDEELEVWRTHEGVYGFEKGLFFSDVDTDLFL